MDVTSIFFPLLILACAAIYWINGKARQWVILLIASAVFYCLFSKPWTFIYVLLSTTSIYIATAVIERLQDVRRRKLVSAITLLINFGILALIKYANLFIETWNFFGAGLSKNFSAIPFVHYAAPLGISFYTLQLVSYFIDFYRGEVKRERNIFKLLLFTCYFPMMISGPICRYGDMRSRLFCVHKFDYERVKTGLVRMAFGLMKKMAIGNRLLVIANTIDGDAGKYAGGYVWISAVIYTVFLYADFSGCMDIMIGASEIFGIRMPENFSAPFFSRNIQEFWRRWHITLGAWLRDYILNFLIKSRLFIDISKFMRKHFGRRAGRTVPAYISMLAVWFCMGLWHGNSWKYIIGEGLWFWLVIVLGMMLESTFKKIIAILHINEESRLWHVFQSLRTFLIFTVGIFFFKAPSMIGAIRQLKTAFSTSWNPKYIPALPYADHSIGGMFGMIIVMIGLIMMFAADIAEYRGDNPGDIIASRSVWQRWSVYLLIIAMIVFSLGTDPAPFAYSEF